MLRGIGPCKVVEPGTGADVAKDGPTVDVSSFTGPVYVVDQLVVVGGEISRYVAVPFGEVAPAVHQVLVVLPDPYDGRSMADDAGSVFPC